MIFAECVEPVYTESVQIVVHLYHPLAILAPFVRNVSAQDPRLLTVVARIKKFQHLLGVDEGAQNKQ